MGATILKARSPNLSLDRGKNKCFNFILLYFVHFVSKNYYTIIYTVIQVFVLFLVVVMISFGCFEPVKGLFYLSGKVVSEMTCVERDVKPFVLTQLKFNVAALH